MPFSHDNIHVQSLKFYPALLWKNLLVHMLEFLENEEFFKFQNLSLDLILARDSEMSLYNHEHMQCVGPTNILSFPHEEMQSCPSATHLQAQVTNEPTYKPPLSPFFNEKKHSPKGKTILRSNLGTLVLSVNTLERECLLYGQDPHQHAVRLLAHGLIHLLGYDHGEEMQELSNQLENNILKKNTSYTFRPIWSYCHG